MKKSMIKYLLFIGFLGISVCLSAQIGINTSSPQGVFHIDSQGNTSGTSNTTDDFVVTSSGDVGIGLLAPTTKLHVKTPGTSTIPVSGFRLQDGSEGSALVLTSDATGAGTWKKAAPAGSATGVLSAGINVPLTISPSYLNTGTYISLLPGRWMVNVVMLIPTVPSPTTHPFWIRSTFSDSAASVNRTSDIVGTAYLVSGISQTNSIYGIMSGFIIINNTSASSKNYYYIVGNTDGGLAGDTPLSNFGGSAWGENNIVAFQIQN